MFLDGHSEHIIEKRRPDMNAHPDSGPCAGALREELSTAFDLSGGLYFRCVGDSTSATPGYPGDSASITNSLRLIPSNSSRK
jgi:hypothetical protein